MTPAQWNQPIGDQVTAVHDGVVTAETLALQVREEIRRREPDLHAWVCLADDLDTQAHLQDHASGTRPLRGVSVGVKDLIDVAGLPTRSGSVVTSADPAGSDAPCITRLRELGAVIQGKTVTTEFGYFAPGPTRNPHDPGHTPGGSSSGSAAAVGAGTVPVALGTQTAGSLTRPASYCGAAGMVLAQGTTSMAGISGLSETLDSLGFLTRTTDDLAYLFGAFTGRTVAPVGSSAVTTAHLWAGSGLDTLHPDMTELLQILPALLADAGVRTDTFAGDDHVRTLADDHLTVMSVEAAATLHDVFDHHAAQLSQPLQALVEQGRRTTADARSAALVRRDQSQQMIREMLADNAIVIGPAAPGPAPAGLSATGSPILSRPWQLLGCPVVIVPGALSREGLPLGVQLIGLPGHEDHLFEVARKLEPLLRSHTEHRAQQPA
ncbi:amidase [Gordonia sp. NPDC003376]